MMDQRFLTLILLWTLHLATGFLPASPRCFSTQKLVATTELFAARYGPSPDRLSEEPPPSNPLGRQKQEFSNLINQVMSVKDPQHIPSLLTKNMDLLLSMSGQEGVAIVESILKDAKEDVGEEAAAQVEEVIELVLSFAEDFVTQTAKIDDQNKKLLGRIILTLSDKENAASDREEALDELLLKEKEYFTPGFLRHVEGECERIANAPKMTPESTRLLQILRMIQTRVLEELGSDLGEAAQVLGQLIGYETKAERLAVLEAGLTVRGDDFVQEMAALTAEALEGFERVPGGADPGLVQCIEEIDERLRRYLDENVGFQ